MVDEGVTTVVKIIGILMILVGVTGTVGGIYTFTLLGDYTSSQVSTREASRSIVDTTLLLTKDSDNIKDSLEDVGSSIDSASENIGLSAKDNKEAAVELRATAQALDPLSTQASISLDEAAYNIEESAAKLEATSKSLNGTGEDMRAIASSVDAITLRVTSSLNDLVDMLEVLDLGGKTDILNWAILYFVIIHLLIAGTGVALLIISGNLYGW